MPGAGLVVRRSFKQTWAPLIFSQEAGNDHGLVSLPLGSSDLTRSYTFKAGYVSLARWYVLLASPFILKITILITFGFSIQGSLMVNC